MIYCATTNPGKLREFRLFADRIGEARFPIDILPGLATIQPPEETGRTFEENAAAKAVYYSAHTAGEYLFAEDSGLEVTALGGSPGVYSARFAGEGASDAANNALLIERLKGASDRSCRYVCVAALARGGTLVKTFRGEVCGEILGQPRGANGFGYDPLFFYPAFGCTFGETPPERKMEVSHRGRALQELFSWLAGNG